jgi:hypothetical protein
MQRCSYVHASTCSELLIPLILLPSKVSSCPFAYSNQSFSVLVLALVVVVLVTEATVFLLFARTVSSFGVCQLSLGGKDDEDVNSILVITSCTSVILLTVAL